MPYLAALGISHVYASPIMQARPGSTHGYDIIDHNRLNPEIGSEADFGALVDALHAHGMGLILDFVPNHMGVGGKDNAWWLDVLEWGRDSPFAAYFDINWDSSRPDLKGRVLLPVLGDQYGVILERGEIALRFDPEEGSFSAWYFDHRFPISPRSYETILAMGGERLAGLARECAIADARRGDDVRERAAELKFRLAERAGETVCRRGDRRRAETVRRRARQPCELSPVAPTARGAGIPDRPLAGCRRGDQLPSLLQYQRACRTARWSSPSCSSTPIGWFFA